MLLKEVVSKNGYDQSGAAKTWWKNLQHFVVLLLEDKQIWEGRTVMSPYFGTLKMLTMMKFLGAQIEINYYSYGKYC